MPPNHEESKSVNSESVSQSPRSPRSHTSFKGCVYTWLTVIIAPVFVTIFILEVLFDPPFRALVFTGDFAESLLGIATLGFGIFLFFFGINKLRGQ